ncbi:hypothetical protein AALO_G00127070 [Alosa alosa]|uniref:ALK and LTK ligand 1 n=1 Tax=Alosa alosa TaxID=278164 RepID=A0AAV6GLC9_9TELE|nr:protein ALKAL-like isoform X2 [Alosa sapidissima]XP_048109225.1 protein ALKAL-like isoform X2 [Alosa alosa]KAG5276023.1 hypothetical protein AALO_G00127070 [Alosa alosa]
MCPGKIRLTETCCRLSVGIAFLKTQQYSAAINYVGYSERTVFDDSESCWKAMQAERKWHILLSIIIMLITSSQCMDSKEAKLKERRTLLDLILQVIGDNQRDKLASRRITSGLFSVPQDLKFSSREKSSYFPKQDRSRPIEVVPRDTSLKDRFINHFTGPVKFSSECRTHFQRLYYNTRDCSRPAYYKRCARLLTRLALSPLCTQS